MGARVDVSSVEQSPKWVRIGPVVEPRATQCVTRQLICKSTRSYIRNHNRSTHQHGAARHSK